MIRVFTIAFVLLGTAFAGAPLEDRMADAIRTQSLLPDAARVELVTMTRVRGAVESIEIANFDRRSGRFEAIISHGTNRAPIKGQAKVSIPVVVARETLRRDHRITASDLEIRFVSIAQVPGTAFSSTDEFEGAAVRRSLPAGRPVRQDDVGPPIVLKKNDLIEIVYETAGMSLMSKGRSLDEGAVGDAVRVKTDRQSSVVIGEVAGPGRVIIR